MENRKDSIKNTADILAESIDGLDKSFINKYLELFSKNNEVKVFIKNGAIDNEVNLENKIDINLDSENNSVIIEERSVKTREDENLVLYFVSSKDMKREAKNISLSFLPYTLIVSFIFSIAISYFYTKIIVSPIVEITKVTNNMMKLEKDALLKVKSYDEIGSLKNQINTLYIRLLGVIDDLDKKNKEIIELEKMKVEFLRSTSHELKTPLASLRIILENMKYNVGKYKDRDKYLSVSIETIDKLTKMTVEILKVSSFQELKDDKELLNINQEVKTILEDYMVLSNNKNIEINNFLDEEEIYMSKLALRKVLANLVSNAVKYSYANGKINIGVKNNYFFIENSCEPLNEKQIKESFDLFSGVEDKSSNGLGLFIVKNILLNYGINYKFEKSDIGMIFYFKLPNIYS
ncbi:HAMP domain-containing sensor histidine kinase [Clostridioides difficile]|uniref:HAMP domain-containing sensor histidine kinase n=1 Tax=Clostridioides difficile TaxID=1496 RepID=UPI000312C8B3|nr:HAMP domain-containing sensor histidine kinase [Clostridioides difficile]MCE4807298.1 HAMP domain-containing histidine kinase [Clostridioides difficile]MCR1748099.1 HAMP domain-containing histidine kinase [Clostridioides difficile]MDV9626662.1 HAMP domain-containing sensor histidine kinase [Clostridioides difficile]MDV9637378.1 HAMP domain-containing sensor histidine kinase [Clostridioides difficile]MDV9643514.1 HAMP domain-containing sensor histidine kinase [Clostridioides difficile]